MKLSRCLTCNNAFGKLGMAKHLRTHAVKRSSKTPV
jgi:hypothetical protein